MRKRASRRAATALTRLGVTLERTAKSERFPALLARRLRALTDRSEFYFVQIGANDGQSHDPLSTFVRANRLRGLVVEPLPDAFERLRAFYAGCPGVKPVNVAIHAEQTRVTLHRPRPELGARSSGIASLDPERYKLTSRRTGIGAADMVAIDVPAMTLADLFERERIDHLDALVIDTEGYDFEILRGLDLDRYRPSIVRFEHGVYSGVAARAQLREALLRFYDHGYSIAMERVDALAWLQEDVERP
ncbi:MAG: FkbM family methyltransferase [Pseudomonadota bacterium]